MALFCAAIRKDSVSLLSPFLAMSRSPRMRFILFVSSNVLVAVINLPPRFLCSLLVVLLMHHRYLESWRVLFHLLFLTHPVCQRHLWDARPCAESLVFLFSGPFGIWSNGPEYLMRVTAEVFIPLMRFLRCSLVSSSFLVLLRYSFYLFFFQIHMFDGDRFQYSQVF